MDNLRDTYKDEDEDTEKSNSDQIHQQPNTSITTLSPTPPTPQNNLNLNLIEEIKDDEDSDELLLSEDDASEDEDEEQSAIPTIDLEDEEDEEIPQKKQKSLSSFTPKAPRTTTMEMESVVAMSIDTSTSTPVPSSSTLKKPKKKNNNVWTKPTSRKGKKKTKSNTHHNNLSGSAAASAAAAASPVAEDAILITPIARFPDRSDDSPAMKICLSKVYKAEKVELSDDRMSAGSCKGYRMVRATRGVLEGAWYYEIKVAKLGETGHTRLGWSMDKGDLQAPVGYDANSFGYRDIDGSKVHKALREKYGEKGYVEGDVIGFYVNLPDGELYAPKAPRFGWYKGQRYMFGTDGKEEALKVVPGSEISFFKNGICQGVAFKDLFGGRYFPAASMYTLPNQPNCVVKFNFGPDFEYFPEDFGGRPLPKPMIDVPYLGFEGKIENGESNEKVQ